MKSWKNTQSQTAVCFLVGALVAVLVNDASGYCQVDNKGSSAKNDPIQYRRDILPILRDHCYSCHGPQKQESNFRIDVKSRALGSADFGDPPINIGNSDLSPLIEFVSGKDPSLMMPPKDSGNSITEEQIQILRQWIDQGANWPDKLSGEDQLVLKTDHWSFQPIRKFDPPLISDELSKKFPAHTEATISCACARRKPSDSSLDL